MPEVRFDGLCGAWRARVDARLASALPAVDLAPQRLHAAMRHAALAGGKRMRPLLVYATGTAFGADEALLDTPAAAVELIHAYSLVHDDLPAMDDDALRRGKPTVHVAFDVATAILAGDALQALAFELLAGAPLTADARVAMLRELAIAAGARGMCGGQALDIDATGARKQAQCGVPDPALDVAGNPAGQLRPDPFGRNRGGELRRSPLSIDDLQCLHTLKTGALLRAAVRLGAIAANVDAATQRRLDAFAEALGLAFQIRDDLLDIEGDSATLGKTAGKDAAQAKATFPALLGGDGARARLQELAAAMTAALAPLGERTTALAALGRHAIERRH